MRRKVTISIRLILTTDQCQRGLASSEDCDFGEDADIEFDTIARVAVFIDAFELVLMGKALAGGVAMVSGKQQLDDISLLFRDFQPAQDNSPLAG